MQKLFAYETFKRDNTRVKITANQEAEMYLYDNLIAVLSPNNRRLYICIDSADWFSNTTKDRLNGILGRTPYEIRQTNSIWDIVRVSTNEKVVEDWNGYWFIIEGNEIK